MRNLILTIITLAILGITLPVNAFAQEEGDYRSAAEGDWSAAATWEVYDSGSWVAASAAPTGSETITVVGDSVWVDVAVSVTGEVVVDDAGVLAVSDGTLEFADGSTYEHARDGGSMPEATWADGSTALFTGIESDAPEDRGQDYYNLTLDTPDMISNNDLSLGGNTIRGNLHAVNSGSSRWRLIGGETDTITVMGDVIVEEEAALETMGSGDLSHIDIFHYGDIDVNGGTFAVSRGSQASGTGTVEWYLFEGDVLLEGAELRNSNPTPGNATLVFASADTQQVVFDDVEFGGGDFHYRVSDSSAVKVSDGFEVNGLLVNEGHVEALGAMTFVEGGVYEHARDGGSMPEATWADGSTALFTGIESDAPEDRGQDYYNLTLDTPDMISNNDLSLGGNTISGDIRAINSGEARWRLIGGETDTITVMGDVIVEENGSLETMGSGDLSHIDVFHYGDVEVDGGSFSVSRGSQASGTGTVEWYLFEGDMTLVNAETRNSNPTPGNARFIFASDGQQHLTIVDGDDANVETLSVEVSDSTTLDLGESVVRGDGVFWLEEGATLATAHPEGIAGNFDVEEDAEVSLSEAANFTFSGTEAQVTSEMMPTTVADLIIANEAGVTLSQQTMINDMLVLQAGVFDNTIAFELGPDAEIVYDGGRLLNDPVSIVADYRSAAQGNWSDASTWEVRDGDTWMPAAAAPDGDEVVLVDDDSVFVNADVSITGEVIVGATGVVAVSEDGSLEFADGGVYEHARDAGSMPEATWADGSTALFTGIELDAPEDRGQDYYNLTLDTPDLVSNNDLSLGGNTIRGDLHAVNSGVARWRLVGGVTDTITVMGDVVVEEEAALETMGSGDLSHVDVFHYGNIDVNGGIFAVSRGSQASGTGTVEWYLFEGDVLLEGAELRNSNPTPGNATLVFASADTQRVVFDDVEFGGGDFHYRVSDSSAVKVGDGFEVNGLLVNEGYVEALGAMTFVEGGVYEHARDGGSVPEAAWAEGSTAVFTGITSDAPEDRGQDYYNLVLDTPDMISNNDLSLGGNTIRGDIRAVNSGEARWRLIGGETDTITVMGDVIVEEDGSLETMGSGDLSHIDVFHYGDVEVDGGSFSVSRGSQASGTGTVEWYLFEGDMTLVNAETRNSNPTPGNARFIFASDTTQQLVIEEGEDSNIETLSIEVAAGATLDVGESVIEGDGVFWLEEGATLATAHPEGIAGNFDVEDDAEVDLGTGTSFAFNGTEAQVTSEMMPATVTDLTIDNEAGVTLSQVTTINGVLTLAAGEFDNTIPFTLGLEGTIAREGGSLVVPVSTGPQEQLPTEFALYQNYPNPFNPSTVIKYDIKEASDVTVTVYDVMGRQVVQLVSGNRGPGSYEIEWDASDLSSGVYYYRIRAGDWSATRSLLLVK